MEDEPLTREELRKLRPSMRSMYILQKEHMTGTKKFANWVTQKVGTMGFFYLLIMSTAGWMLWNTYAPLELQFDKAPDFFLFVLIASLLSLVLLPLIMVGQNLQEIKANARSEADFELNKIEEKEIDTILRHLENQNELILKILARVEGEVKEGVEIEKKDFALKNK
jgi:uncharacterized membrane protein